MSAEPARSSPDSLPEPPERQDKIGVFRSSAAKVIGNTESVSSGRPIQIILVEDHPAMQETIQALLHEDPGLHVCALAASAEEALGLADLASADLILVDISLPEMNGIQLVRELRVAQPSLRCLMLSSHTQASYVDSSLAAGAHGYVDKRSLLELYAAIRSVLAGDVYLSTRVRASHPG
jgi:DNA-binding NarL/FixJ family response regulator